MGNKQCKVVLKRNKYYVYGDIEMIDSSRIMGYSRNSKKPYFSMEYDLNNILQLKQQRTVIGDKKLVNDFKRRLQRKQTLYHIANKDKPELKPDIISDGYNKELKPYQMIALEFFLAGSPGVIIGYDRGLGKSLIAINCMRQIIKQGKKVLIICPNYLKFSWGEEIEKWSSFTYTIVHGNKQKRDEQIQQFQDEDNEILIMNYEQAKVKCEIDDATGEQTVTTNVPDYLQKTKFGLITWDEAQRLKNRESQNSMGAYSLIAEKRLMLTGTPISKNAGEIWSLFHILDRKRFTHYWTFCRYLCELIPTVRDIKIGHVLKPQEYLSIVNEYMIRKLKEDVEPDLPPKIIKEIYVDMEGEQLKTYKKAVDEYLKPSNERIRTDVEQFVRLNQIANCPAILEEGKNVSISRDTVLDLLEDFPDERVIVACSFVGMSEILADSIKKQYKDRNIYLNNSKVPINKRNDLINAFKKDDTGIIVTTIKCLAEGVNLDCCHNIITVDNSWNCGDNDQFFDRIHRLTSTKPKNYFVIIVKNSVLNYKYNKVEKERYFMAKYLDDTERNIIFEAEKDFKQSLLLDKETEDFF